MSQIAGLVGGRKILDPAGIFHKGFWHFHPPYTQAAIAAAQMIKVAAALR